MKYYAGIGSRTTPKDALLGFQSLGEELAKAGWILRSGNCDGADKAFQHGANSFEPKEGQTTIQVFLPYEGYGGYDAIKDGHNYIMPPSTPEAYQIAEKYHPAWHRCNEGARRFHARNVEIILGHDLETEVEFVVCWCWDENKGGTSMGIRIADSMYLPVYNFCKPDDVEKFHNDKEGWLT